MLIVVPFVSVAKILKMNKNNAAANVKFHQETSNLHEVIHIKNGNKGRIAGINMQT